MNHLDITIIILTYNEELHIRRCIENVKPIAKEIIVIDCVSTDATRQICEELGAKVVEHAWPGNQAAQFNWALENVDIKTEWIFRIDADEYLSEKLKEEIFAKLPKIAENVTGIMLKRKVFFLNRLMKHGPTINLLRIFKTGHGRSEVREMDEHIILERGYTEQFNALFYDHSLIDIDDWTRKHLNYAKRNAAEFLNMKLGLRATDNAKLEGQASLKRKLKRVYFNFPLFVRPIFYFIYRYFLLGSFLDGKEGFLWCFYQGWWYSNLVDTRIREIMKACGDDKEKTRDYLKEKYGIQM